MADQKVERDLPAELQIFFIPQHRFWMKFHGKSMKKADFDQALELCNFANNPWNFLKPRFWIFWGRRVPIVLPKISATTMNSQSYEFLKCGQKCKKVVEFRV